MLSSLKRLTKHSAVYGLGHIVTRIINFLLIPLYTNVLPTDEFGATQVVYAFIAVMTILYTIGIDAAFLRYFILTDDPAKRQRVFSTAFWTVLVSVISLTALVYTLAPRLNQLLIGRGDYAYLLEIASFILAFDAMAFLPFLFLRAEEKSVFYTSLKFINVLINVALNIYFIVYLNMGAKGMLLANLWASGLTFAFTLFILVRQISFEFDMSELRTLLKFGLPFLPSTLSVVLLDLIDRPLLVHLAGLEETGVYSANAKLGMFMALLVTAFRFAWHPFFLSTSKQENAPEIFSKVLTYFTLLGAGVFLGLSFFIDSIAKLAIGNFTLLGSEYWQGLHVVPPILLSYVFYGMYVNFIVGIYLKEKTKYLPIITFSGVLINIGINLLLVPKIGIMGAAWARLAGHIVMCLMLYFFSRRFYVIHYEFGRLGKLALIVAALFYFGYTFQGDWQLTVRIGCLVAFPFLLLGFGFFEKREIDTLRNLFKPAALRN